MLVVPKGKRDDQCGNAMRIAKLNFGRYCKVTTDSNSVKMVMQSVLNNRDYLIKNLENIIDLDKHRADRFYQFIEDLHVFDSDNESSTCFINK